MDLAAIAYDAFCRAVTRESYGKNYFVKAFETIDPELHKAWIDSAEAVRTAIKSMPNGGTDG